MRNGQAGNAAALWLIRRVLGQDPDLGIAHALAARCFHVQRMMGWLSPDDPKLAEGIQHANTAVALGDNDPEALWMAGLAIMNIDGDLTRGRRLIDQSLAINPNSAERMDRGQLPALSFGERRRCAQPLPRG